MANVFSHRLTGPSIDRAFINAKLARITRRLSRARLDPALARELQQRARRALSHAVTGRYPEAN